MDADGTPHAGHGHGHGDHAAQFRRLFWVMLVLAVPTVALSGMFAMTIGYTMAARRSPCRAQLTGASVAAMMARTRAGRRPDAGPLPV